MEDTNKEYELKRAVENWVDRNFNCIQLDVYERIAEGILFEHIKQESVIDYIDDYLDSLDEEEREELEKEAEDGDYESLAELIHSEYEQEVREWMEDARIEHYPMWNTLFEWRSEIPEGLQEEWYEKCERAGFGIIYPFDSFNSTLFVTGAGYSFYAQHWIPLYLSLYEQEAEKYKGVNFRHL